MASGFRFACCRFPCEGALFEYEDTLRQVTVIDPAAGAAEGEDTTPATGADRALRELRSELAAGLRNRCS